MNAAAELPDPALPARQVARDHKEALRAWILQRLHALGAAGAEVLLDAALRERRGFSAAAAARGNRARCRGRRSRPWARW